MPTGEEPCVLGIIGGIGSGKSRVAQELQRRGGRVLTADEFGHEALRQKEIKAALVRRWGPGILNDDGEIDRRQVAALVFANADERRALEKLVFPFIGRRIDEEIARARGDPSVRFVILDAAVMLESGWDRRCDWIVYVHAPRAQRWQRVLQTRGWTEQEVRARARAQWPLTDKATRADFVVDNSGEEDYLKKQVDKLLEQLHNLNCNVSQRQ